MSLSAWAILVLVPPVNLVWLAVLGWLWRRRRAGQVLAAASLAGLLALATPLVADALLASLEWGVPRSEGAAGDAQAIVVLGAELSVGVTPAGSVSVAPGPLTLQRLRAAAALARRTGLPLLVSGGIVHDGAPPVAAVMAQSLAADFAVPARWIEPRSADTWENARDSAALLSAAGIHTALLVTHAWHVRRAMIAFAAAGLRVTPAPGQWDRFPQPSLGGMVPRAASWMTSYYALHEWIGCLWYGWRARGHGAAP